jgi:hypothetical protein
VGFCTVHGPHVRKQREREKESNKAAKRIFSTTTYVDMSVDIITHMVVKAFFDFWVHFNGV